MDLHNCLFWQGGKYVILELKEPGAAWRLPDVKGEPYVEQTEAEIL